MHWYSSSPPRAIPLLSKWAWAEPPAKRWPGWVDRRGSHHSYSGHWPCTGQSCWPLQTACESTKPMSWPEQDPGLCCLLLLFLVLFVFFFSSIRKIYSCIYSVLVLSFNFLQHLGSVTPQGLFLKCQSLRKFKINIIKKSHIFENVLTLALYKEKELEGLEASAK